jgi:tRNA(Ile)-lysidine synthase
MESLKNRLEFAFIQPFLTAQMAKIESLWVGYSGGVDSHVLLHLIALHRQALGKHSLKAVYVDHGLNPASDQWRKHCQTICQDLAVAFFSLHVDARPRPGESPEAAARRARYNAFEGVLKNNDALLLAHHQDDQAETLLLQLLRGAGPRGLAAMPTVASLGRGLLLRPLLEAERVKILDYAHHHGLQWVEDSSNSDCGLDRNYLRHEILPRLKRRWPAATRTLARSARLCAEAETLLDSLADDDLDRATMGHPYRLDIQALRTLNNARQRNALRRWFQRLDLPTPSAIQLQHVLEDAIAAPHDRIPCIHWPGCEVRRYQDSLYAMAPLPPHDPGQIFVLKPGITHLSVVGSGQLYLHPVQGAGVRLDELIGRSVTVRFRRGGERFRPQGHRHSQRLKTLFQSAGVPPWERDRRPLLYVDNKLVAVAGLGIDADFVAGPEEMGWILAWQKQPPSDNV